MFFGLHPMMNKAPKNFTIWVIAALLLPAAARVIAEEPLPQQLSLSQLEQMAIANNPAAAAAAARVEALHGKWLQVGLRPNPRLGYNGDEIGDEGAAGLHSIHVSQEFVRGGKLYLNRAVVEQEIARAEALWMAQQRRVLTDVHQRFFEALVRQQRLATAQRLVNIGQEAVKTAEQLFKAKEVGRLDVLQAKLELNNARLQLAASQTQAEQAWHRLTAIVGMPDLPQQGLSGNPADNLPELTWETSMTRLLQESPEVAAAWANVQRAEWNLSRQCAGRVQNLDVSAGAGYDDATGDAFGRVGISIPLPIHNANQGNIAQAQAEVVAATRNAERLQLALRDRLAIAFQAYDSARREYQIYQNDIVPDARDSWNIVQSGYPTEFNYLNLIAAQRDYFQAELGKLDSLNRLRQHAASIEGLLLNGSLSFQPGIQPIAATRF